MPSWKSLLNGPGALLDSKLEALTNLVILIPETNQQSVLLQNDDAPIYEDLMATNSTILTWKTTKTTGGQTPTKTKKQEASNLIFPRSASLPY